MAWKDVTITDAGEKLLAEMVNGSELILTRAAIGAGTVPVEELPSLTDVIEPITAPALLAGEESTDDGKIIKIQVRNDGVAETTRMRQIAIYAKTDHEDEVLFVILQDEIGEEIPSYDEFPQFDIEQWVTLALSRTNNITVTVNPLAFVPAVEFEKEVKRLDTTKADKTEISNPNLLDNWYFADPINQRGETKQEREGLAYLFDRWLCEKSVSTEDDGYVQIPLGRRIIQKLEEYLIESFHGKYVTLSILTYDKRLYSGSLMFDKDMPDPFYYFCKGETLPSLYYEPEFKCIGIVVEERYMQETLKIIAAKLELGDRQTLARQDTDGNWVLNDPPPNKALELAKCQRYFQRIERTGYTTGYVAEPMRCYIPIHTPVTLRTTPTVTDIETYGNVHSNGTEVAPTDIKVAVYNSGEVILSLTMPEQLTVHHEAIWTDFELSLDANL